MKSKLLAALLILFLASAFASPRPASAAALVVTTLADESDGSCSDGDCSLRDAIALAPQGETIGFSVSGTIALSMGQLTISKSLTLAGPGASLLTISGNNAFRVFEINAGLDATVTVSDLTIANGNSGNWFGGGIYNSTIFGGSHLALSRCRFENNHSNGDGGGIYNSGEMTVDQCVFSGNSASSGGGIASSFGSASIAASAFTDNNASDDGGAIYAVNGDNGGFLSLASSTFTGNQSASDGGAIYTDWDTPLTVVASHFSENRALWGGAISHHKNATISQSAFFDNTAYSTGYNNGEGYGGGIFASGTLTLTNTSFYSNTAEAGGGLYTELYENILVRNNSFSANRATFTGDNLRNRGWLTIQNTLVANAPQDGCSSSTNLTGGSTHNLSTDSSCVSLSASFTQVSALDLALSWQQWMLTLGSGSAAIDAGDNAACPAIDQRGWLRPLDGDEDGAAICDVGAHEFTPNMQSVYLPLLVK